MSLTENGDQVFLPGGATELKIWDLAPTLNRSMDWMNDHLFIDKIDQGHKIQEKNE